MSQSEQENTSLWNLKEALFIAIVLIGIEIFFNILHKQVNFTVFVKWDKIPIKIATLYYVLFIRIIDFAFISYFIFKLKKTWLKSLGISTQKVFSQIKTGVLVCLFLGLTVLLIQVISLVGFQVNVLKNFFVPAGKTLLSNKAYLTSYIFVAILCAPLIEEIFFRGILFNALIPHSKAYIRVICNGFLFAGAHGLLGNFFPVQFIGGLVFAALYKKTNSIIPSFIVHSSGNLAIVCIVCYYS